MSLYILNFVLYVSSLNFDLHVFSELQRTWRLQRRFQATEVLSADARPATIHADARTDAIWTSRPPASSTGDETPTLRIPGPGSSTWHVSSTRPPGHER